MRKLAPGETVVVDVRPHWKFLVGPATLLAVVIAGVLVGVVEGMPGWVYWVALATLVLAGGRLARRYLRWATTRLVVTDSRIVERRGILGRSGREIPLSALSDIGYRQTLFDRLLGAGDVIIESAARDGQEVFPDLPHPMAIQNEIHAQLQQRPPRGPAPTSIPEQIDQLDQLRRRGVISEEEFEAKKTALLDRL